MITIAKKRQTMVFAVNIDSPSKVQVNIGNTINPVVEPINRADHAESVCAAINFQAYQNKIDAGIPNTIADVSGLVFQNSLMS